MTTEARSGQEGFERLRIDPVRAENLRTLFQQVPTSLAGATIATLYRVAIAWPFHDWRKVGLWLALQLASQVYRLWLIHEQQRIPADDDGSSLEREARNYTIYMMISGLIWGSAAFFFMDASQPVTVALTLCGLYGISGGSVPGNAYNPVGLWVFIGSIFGLVMLRMLTLGHYGYIILGLASLGFAGILLMFSRVQHRALNEGFAIRFENRRLLAVLDVEKLDAEAGRAKAEKVNLAKSQFLAAASHDLRQPLHALSLFSGSLQSLGLDQKAKDIAARIQSDVTSLENRFNGLLDISRLEAGMVQRNRKSVACQDIFDRLASDFDPIAEKQGLDLRFAETALWIDTDAALVEQICIKLVTNALRYTHKGGILVAARRRDGFVSIEVSDTGVGIALADQARIFDEGVQIGNPQGDRSKGLGLGLAIAQRLAVILDSHIELKSAEGQGSRFAFRLPRAAPAQATTAAAPPDLSQGKRLLLVEDDAMLRESTRLLLVQWGVDVALAPDLITCERLVAEEDEFDICLVDYRLPGSGNGLDVIARLSALPRAPKAFCLVTGNMGPEVLAAAEAAAVPILHKPVHPARLRALLNHLLTIGEHRQSSIEVG